jgi:hypothetical protein
MKLHDFLAHHGVTANPFADEDAQTDPVFQGRCRLAALHPNWDKIYGDPQSPATSIVFGEKGAGKTALRLQMAAQIAAHNEAEPNRRLFVIEYDDFNPFLDRFAERLSGRKRRDAEKVLAEWKLWDHMDAILSLGTTCVVDRLLQVSLPTGPPANALPPDAAERLDRFQRRDLLLLAAAYDNSTTESFPSRWHRLRRKVGYRSWQSWGSRALGTAITACVLAGILWLKRYNDLLTVWPWLIIALGWAPWLAQAWLWWTHARGVARNLRCVVREAHPLRQVLMQFARRDIQGQPLPSKRRTDDRYELLNKFQGVLNALGFSGIIVLVDRVDEPHLINGAVSKMKGLVWSMLDNKFLKQPGLGLKLLLPIELQQLAERENRDFYQRARLDKQNVVPSLEWTGESLYDLANARLAACSAAGAQPQLRHLFESSVTDQRLIDAFAALRVPRHLFKFLYRLLVAHCQRHVDTEPVWLISHELFETQWSLYRREQRVVDQGLVE